jgi:hypothetical protein
MQGFSWSLTDAAVFVMDAPGHNGKEIDMAEIKSTLELIMERTKNLTMTDEEKEAIRTKELKSRIRGLFQRYSDGVLTMRNLTDNMEHERASSPAAATLLKEECLVHLDPAADNQKIMQIIEEVLGLDPAPFRLLVDDFRAEITRQRALAARDSLAALSDRGVRGTAVIPNPGLSPAWHDHLESARKEFRNKLYLVK